MQKINRQEVKQSEFNKQTIQHSKKAYRQRGGQKKEKRHKDRQTDKNQKQQIMHQT